MFIVWRKRPVVGDKRTPFLKEPGSTEYERTPWKPMYCDHKGVGRVAWTPLVMHSERREGKPRQKVLERLPTIRSCCIADGFNRAAWWHDIERTITGWLEAGIDPMDCLLARDKGDMLSKLREVVPRPTPAGLRDFTAYRLAKEAERKDRDDADRRWWREEAERQHREREQARRATQDSWGAQNQRFWDDYAARFSGSGAERCFAVLGLEPDATLDDLKRRHRELVMEHHPDRGGDPKEFVKVQTAYERACELLEGRRSA